MSSDQVGQIGPYRVVETLGEGGMGVVYLAEQTEPVQRMVALKVLKPGADSDVVLARFEAERRALAVMNHPSIAKIFDAGTTEDGRSYFAMEHVIGAPVTQYCDERRLTVRQRAALFIQICHAVQHAHQKGLIHRDLKPSNILVSDGDGQPLPRIIDFGIAKATQVDEFDGTQLTRDDQVIGTPAYMSPEQIDGSGDVDTRTDIYALGVLLYEVLVGALPYESSAYRGWAAVAAQLLREPPTPAQRLNELADTQLTIAEHRSTTLPSLRKELGGDLGWIVSRSMEKDRERRYETANGMALDLRRLLAHEPVRAHGASTAYVVGKFVRRNRLGVAFGATVAIGLVAFSVVTSVQADRIARARDEAETRRGQAEGVLDFMLSDLWEKLRPMGRLDVLNDAGDQALSYFASLPEELFSDSELLSRSQALYQIGDVRLAEGRLPSADTAFTESLRLARELSRRDPSNNEWLFGLGQAEFWVGELARRKGDLASADERFREYRDISAELVSRDGADLTYLKEQGYSHTNVGAVRRQEGRVEEALAEFRSALEVKERVVEADPSFSNRYDLSRSHNTVGIVLSDLGSLAEAVEFLSSDIAIKQELLEEAPANATIQDRLAVSLQFLGEVRWASGDVPGALERFQRAEEILTPLVDQDPDNAVRRRALVIARGWIASLLSEADRSGEALTILQDNLSVMRALSAGNPDQPTWSADVANQLRREGEVLLRLGQTHEAERAALEAVDVLQALGASEELSASAQREMVSTLMLLGDARSAADNHDEARSAWSQALQLAQSGDSNTRHRVERELEVAGLLRLDRADEAAPLLRDLTSRGFGRPALMRIAREARITTN
jgi:serine/threonine-protein kinase